jgi:hypothetical protein
MSAISFHELNGKINAVLEGDDLVIELNKQATKELWIEGRWDSNIYYVYNGEACLRPPCPAALESNRIVNLPTPCVIDINGVHYDCNEDTAEIDLGLGAHQITVLAFPYLNGVFNVEN